MAPPIKNKNTILKKVTADMKALGVHQPQFDRILDIYCDMLLEYQQRSAELTDADYRIRSKLLLSVENLRGDILTYASQLGLTPAGHRKLQGDRKPAGKVSKLELALLNNA